MPGILQGKRIALAGFSVQDASDLTSRFEAKGAFCRSILLLSAAPGSPDLEGFDLLAGTLEASRAWFAVARRASEIPLLIVDDAARLTAEVAQLEREGRTFALNDAPAADLCLRAAVLLQADAGNRRSERRHPIVVTADDDLSITALVKAMLSSDGIVCETADNGSTALELARKLKPDVVVLDVNMPGLGGFEVLSALKLDPMTASMRVILLTGAEQESDIMRGFSLGAADYVVKPFNPMELLVRIRRFIRT